MGAVMVAWFAPAYGIELNLKQFERMTVGANALVWLAALVTLWTGIEYGLAAWRGLKAKAGELTANP
jgi:phosphatidylglycerophosphate synthase